MLNDARSLWTSASSVVQNLASALADEMQGGDDREELRRELEVYKSMLEEAQMAVVELSKASQMAVAEKEAELAVYKGSGPTPDSAVLENARLLADKAVLTGQVDELEERLGQLLVEKNQAAVRGEMYEEVCLQLKALKTQFANAVGESSSRDSLRSETIENLVQEYSQLAAEFEASHQKSETRIAELSKENEVLVMKMHALELSLSELADREQVKASGGDVDAQMALQLKEARSRIVTLQYDLRQKSEELDRVRQGLQEGTASGGVVGGEADALMRGLKERVVVLEEELSRLRSARGEAEEAGRKVGGRLMVATHEELTRI